VVLALIPTAWLAVVFFALKMFHVASHSDDCYDLAMAEGIAANHVGEHWAFELAFRARRLPPDPRYRIGRATG
jgi:hypothetical protein